VDSSEPVADDVLVFVLIGLEFELVDSLAKVELVSRQALVLTFQLLDLVIDDLILSY
jgi:hypothetical protein